MESLTIKWKKQDAPQDAKNWAEIKVPPAPFHQDLSKSLGLAPNCIDYLEQAFKQNLNRATGWEVVDEDGFQAAKIYKRGVSVKSTSEDVTATSKTSEGSYPVEIFSEKDPVEKILSQKNTLFFIDQNVYDAWQDLLSKVESKIIVTVSEKNKSLEFIADLFKHPEIGKVPHWVAIGGGILTDCVAFAASLKNKKITLVPTTLLAMVDASVGGKTGVNFQPYGKNQVGSFYFPEKVMVWSGWLSTLDQRNLRGGSNECFKHAILKGDKELLEKLGSNWIEQENFDVFMKQLIKVKADVVIEDPTEKGVRATLNFGHTLAHALEAFSQANSSDHILHGEAVGLGMIFACMLSESVTGFPTKHTDHIIAAMKKSKTLIGSKDLTNYLGTNLNNDSLSADLWKLTLHDKKMTSDKQDQSSWVFLDDLGKPHQTGSGAYVTPVSNEPFHKTWQRFIAVLD